MFRANAKYLIICLFGEAAKASLMSICTTEGVKRRGLITAPSELHIIKTAIKHLLRAGEKSNEIMLV